jgi:FYVE/RhoGEF/PH domain-containing protein 5/6
VAIDRYKNKIQNSKFLSILAEGEKHPLAHRNNFESMLILPVQRVPRYVLLLSDLMKNTDENHPDYTNITKSYEAIKSLADSIDEAIGKAKSRAQCIEIQSRIETLFGRKALPFPTLVEAHRVLLKESVLKKQGSSGKTVDQKFYLFNDLLLVTPVHAEKFQTSLKPYYIQSITVKNLKPTDLSFQILSFGESFTVFAPNMATKNEWIKMLEEAISGFKKNIPRHKLPSELAPLWYPDDAAAQCMRCDTAFGVIVRKHHCRNCGAVVCKTCSAHTAIVPGVDKNKEVRVCNVCKKILTYMTKV